MTDPTATLSIDRASLALPALVFDGSDSGTTQVLVELSEAASISRTTYAPAGRFMPGLTPVASTWEHTNLVAVLRLEGSTASALATLKAALRVALGRLTFPVTTTVNGVAVTYTADRGSMVLLDDTLAYENLRRNVERYRVTIPVSPVTT